MASLRHEPAAPADRPFVASLLSSRRPRRRPRQAHALRAAQGAASARRAAPGRPRHRGGAHAIAARDHLVVGQGGDAVRAALRRPISRSSAGSAARHGRCRARRARACRKTASRSSSSAISARPARDLAALVRRAAAGKLAVLTARVPDPAGSDASCATRRAACAPSSRTRRKPRERAIHEINTGVLAAPTALLRRWVGALKPTTRTASST